MSSPGKAHEKRRVTKTVDSDSITTLERRPETSEEIEVSFAWAIKKVFPDPQTS
jgi:hypothetical protein